VSQIHVARSRPTSALTPARSAIAKPFAPARRATSPLGSPAVCRGCLQVDRVPISGRKTAFIKLERRLSGLSQSRHVLRSRASGARRRFELVLGKIDVVSFSKSYFRSGAGGSANLRSSYVTDIFFNKMLRKMPPSARHGAMALALVFFPISTHRTREDIHAGPGRPSRDEQSHDVVGKWRSCIPTRVWKPRSSICSSQKCSRS